MPYAKSSKRTYRARTGARKSFSKSTKKSPYSVSTGTFRKRRNRASIAAVVKSVIAKSAETKETSSNWTNVSVLNTVEYVSASQMYANRMIMNAIPGTASSASGALLNVVQGTGQANRVGNVIQPTYCSLDMMFFPKPYNETFNIDPCPCEIMIWILKPKINITGFTPTDMYTATQTAGIFQFGNSDLPLSGVLTDTMYRINDDQFTLLGKRRIKIGNQFVNQGIGAADGYSNNDFKMNQRVKLNLTKFMPKRLRWNDTDNNAQATPIYILIEKIRADNLPVTDATSFVGNIGFSGSYTLKYKDI